MTFRRIFQIPMVCGILVVSLTCLSISEAQQANVPSTDFVAGVGSPLPNVDLPTHVVAPEGKLSFYADFLHPADKGCPIYLINRTDKATSVGVQDGALFMALAVKMSEGVWRKAQVHESSFCGNSYYSVVLPPGQHFKSFGYQPKTGVIGKVRYQFFGGMETLVSNEGAGYWNEADLAAGLESERDVTRIRESLLDFMTWGPQPGGDLAKAESAVLWLELAGRCRQDRAYLDGIEEVRGLVRSLSGNSSKNLAEWAARLDALAGRQAAELSATAVRQGCEEIIRNTPVGSDLEAGKLYRVWAAWDVANWLLRSESSAGQVMPSEWSAFFNLAQQRLPVADARESIEIGILFRNTRLTSEHVRTDLLITYANSSVRELSEACLNQLAERQRFQELAEIGMKGSPELRLRILRWFCAEPKVSGGSGRLRDGVYEFQRGFWEKCVSEDPWSSMAAMQSGVGYNQIFFLEPWLSLLFRDYFTKLMDTAEAGFFPVQSQEQSIGLRKYVEVLNRDPGIVPIRLLKRAAGLIKSAPAGEPQANAQARKNLAYAAGRELRMEEFFR